LRLLVQKNELALCLDWIKQHPKSFINTSILYNQLVYLTPYISESELKKVFYSMPAAITGNIWGKELRYHIDSLFIGATAPDFVEPDTSGRQFSLTNFRGKYVLVDFWASWCVPCRKEDPGLVKIMRRFGGTNFTILSISVDDKRDNWIKAIKQDGLHWPQLSSLNGLQNPASIKYYANAIPFSYLIDPTGKIIAKNLRGDELTAKLDSLFK
jgi:thiol-disulfide isomerase/thioredoxin